VHQGEAGPRTRSNPSVPPADDSGDQRRGTGLVGKGGVGEKPCEGFASTGPAPKTLPLKKRHAIKRMKCD